MQLLLLGKTRIMNKFLGSHRFQAQVRIKLQDRYIYDRTIGISIPHTG